MSTTSKTIPVVEYPDGSVYPITKDGRWYAVPYPADHPMRGAHRVQYMADVVRHVTEAGGRVVRRANPRYRPSTGRKSLRTFDALMGGMR